MAKIKILGRIGEFEEECLPNLRAVVEKAGGTARRTRIVAKIEPLPTTRSCAGAMLEQFLENNSLVRHDLQAPIGTYERDVACDMVKELLHRLKWELKKSL